MHNTTVMKIKQRGILLFEDCKTLSIHGHAFKYCDCFHMLLRKDYQKLQ